jgi:hypothetical protein
MLLDEVADHAHVRHARRRVAALKRHELGVSDAAAIMIGAMERLARAANPARCAVCGALQLWAFAA